MMGINVLIKETQDSLSPVLEHRISCLNTSKRALTRCRSSWDPDLRLPSLQSCEKPRWTKTGGALASRKWVEVTSASVVKT